MIKKTALILLGLGLAAACGHHEVVLNPPNVDLAQYEPVGLIAFTIEGAKGDIDQLASQAFLTQVNRAQRVPVLEMGKLEAVLEKVQASTVDPDSARAIGEAFRVRSFFLGTLKIKRMKAQVDLSAALNARLRVRTSTEVSATVRLVAADTGATLWTNQATLDGTLGVLGAGKDEVPYIAVRDQDRAARDFINELMFELTWDFRPTQSRR